MPAEDGRRSEEDEMPPPGRVELCNDQSERSIRAFEVRPGARAERDLKLVGQA